MKAIVFKDLATWTYEERSVPEIKKVNDVLVEVEAASICGTDVHVLGNPPGFIGTKVLNRHRSLFRSAMNLYVNIRIKKSFC